jgi:hypothetical protein
MFKKFPSGQNYQKKKKTKNVSFLSQMHEITTLSPLLFTRNNMRITIVLFILKLTILWSPNFSDLIMVTETFMEIGVASVVI